MALTIRSVRAVEILDSRARPTLSVSLEIAGGAVVRAGVPAGTSTGAREAVELRDGDPRRYGGQGVLRAVAAINGEIDAALAGRSFISLAAFDDALIALDGTPDKSRLGANSLVGVSIAAARGFAAATGTALWQAFVGRLDFPRFPVPHFNILSGGVQALTALDFQEFMIAPVGAPTIAEAVRAGAEIYAALRSLLHGRGLVAALGDEGGFAPELRQPEAALELLVDAIAAAGYHPGLEGVAIAVDAAATRFFAAGTYTIAGEPHSSDDLIARYSEMVGRFPIRLIEDGLADTDWAGWERLTAALGDRVELAGDDLFCTNPSTIALAVDRGIANAVLIKPNQIGTVSETLHAMRICRDAGYRRFVAHRSGETPDTFIADLAVGTGTGRLKAGAPARGERVAKYDRLLQIAAGDAGCGLTYGLR